MDGFSRSLSLNAICQACLRNDQPREKDSIMLRLHENVNLSVAKCLPPIDGDSHLQCPYRTGASVAASRLRTTESFCIIANLLVPLQPASHPILNLLSTPEGLLHAELSASDNSRLLSKRNRRRAQLCRANLTVTTSPRQPSNLKPLINS